MHKFLKKMLNGALIGALLAPIWPVMTASEAVAGPELNRPAQGESGHAQGDGIVGSGGVAALQGFTISVRNPEIGTAWRENLSNEMSRIIGDLREETASRNGQQPNFTGGTSVAALSAEILNSCINAADRLEGDESQYTVIGVSFVTRVWGNADGIRQSLADDVLVIYRSLEI
jgi:hypothetical protein